MSETARNSPSVLNSGTNELAKKNYDAIEYGNRHGRLKYGHIHKEGDVTSAILLEAADAEHSFCMDADGTRKGWTSSIQPGHFQLECGSTSTQVEDSLVLNAKNGNIIINAGNGNLRFEADNIEFVSRGSGTNSGNFKVTATEKVLFHSKEFSVNATEVSDPTKVKWNHFIEDMTNVPGVDYDVCYNYADGSIYYRDDMEYEDCECYYNTYDENDADYDPNYPGINADDSCKEKIGLFQGTYYDEVETYRPKWISVMWCCVLDYGKINVEGFAAGSIRNQFNGFTDFIIKSDVNNDVDLNNSESIGEYITFDINGEYDTDKLKLSWYIDGVEQVDLENQLEVTFDRPDDDSMITYSWQVHDLTGNLIAPNDPLNPLDLYAGIFNLYGGWSYYDPDPNTNPNNNPNNPYVGSWFWHKTDGNVDHDDTVDLSNLDNYLYAEQCCSLGYSYKINWKNYEPATISTSFSKNDKPKNFFNIKPEINNNEKVLTVDLSNTNIDISIIEVTKVKKEFVKNNNINFNDKYIITFHDKEMNPIYALGLGNPFETRLQHIGYEKESIFNIEIPIKNYKIAYPSDLDPYFITYSKRSINNTFEAIKVVKIQ